MKTFKGTQGPWSAIQYANFFNIQTESFYGEKDLLNAEDVGEEVAKANSKLMASSPDLLTFALEYDKRRQSGFTQRDLNNLAILCDKAIYKAIEQ
jgi:hypothetical protein